MRDRRAGLFLLVLATSALTGCGASPEAGTPLDTITPSEGGDLPTLPPLQERGFSTDVVNAEGCVRLAPSPSLFDCGAPYPAEGPDFTPPPDEAKALRGFDGLFYNVHSESGELAVLEQTVSTDTHGSWGARGLVRNETDAVVGTITVTAHLLDSRGEEIDQASASTLVAPAREGEPVPFEITSGVDATQVANVRWATAADAPGDPRTRDTEILVHWTLPYGERERLTDAESYSDPPTPPYPFLMMGNVYSLSGRGHPRSDAHCRLARRRLARRVHDNRTTQEGRWRWARGRPPRWRLDPPADRGLLPARLEPRIRSRTGPLELDGVVSGCIMRPLRSLGTVSWSCSRWRWSTPCRRRPTGSGRTRWTTC